MYLLRYHLQEVLCYEMMVDGGRCFMSHYKTITVIPRLTSDPANEFFG